MSTVYEIREKRYGVTDIVTIEIINRDNVKMYTEVCGAYLGFQISRYKASQILASALHSEMPITRKVRTMVKQYGKTGHPTNVLAVINSDLCENFNRNDWTNMLDACVDQGA